jgi:hypothetical protein
MIKILLKGDSHAVTSVFQCGRRIYSIKSMECHLFVVLFTLIAVCLCLLLFLVLDIRFKYVEFPCYL